MADNSILTPGQQEPVENPITLEPTQYLMIDNFFSEYETEEEKAIARENLNVPSRDNIYDQQEVNTRISTGIRNVIQEHLNQEDPHGILPQVEEMVTDMVKTDGSTPFIAPQKGADPVSELHLTTKRYVDKLVRDHVNTEDPHNIIPEIETLLEKYVKVSDVYNKSQLYTKRDIDKQIADYIKKDGTTPFTKAQIGADPQIDSHLTTKRYVDKIIYEHKVDVDPHGFYQILNQRLPAYAKRKDVFDKTQTYSRIQIDSIINKVVNSAIDIALKQYMDLVDDKFEYIKLQKYTKQDGSIPFRAPQSGVDAIQEQDLVTLRQLNSAVEQVSQQIELKECVWKTSGPVESTVGHIDDNTPVPATMTVQEVFDAMFYGKGISISVPEYVTINNKAPITLCVHGSTGLVELAEVYYNETLIETFVGEDFKEGCISISSPLITEDAQFTFKVIYTNGATHTESTSIKVALPTFVGLLPKWKSGNTITWEYLQTLTLEDSNNNKFINISNNLSQISTNYNFQDKDLKHLFVIVPSSYPNLENISISSQKFGLEAFDIIDMIPLQIPGIQKDIIFKIYIYRQALSSLNQEVTFNFTQK